MIISLILTTSLFIGGTNLNQTQIQKINITYKIGKSIEVNGMNFAYTLPSIMGVESSFGKIIIGDQYSNGKLKSLYQSSLGPFQIRLETAKLVIQKTYLRKKYGYLIYKQNKKKLYEKYFKIKKKLVYYKSILQNTSWKQRARKGNIKAIETLSWAKRRYKYNLKLSYKLSKKIYKDIILINLLLNNTKFSALIAGNYLKMLYIEAQKKGYKYPYFRALGRYNGGWNNKKYARKVLKMMKLVKKIIKYKK